MSRKDVYELSIRPITCFAFNKDCSRKFYDDIFTSVSFFFFFFFITKLLKSIATGAMATLTMKNRASFSVALIMAFYRVRITHRTRKALLHCILH